MQKPSISLAFLPECMRFTKMLLGDMFAPSGTLAAIPPWPASARNAPRSACTRVQATSHPPPLKAETLHIVVIGGGLAGLSAALEASHAQSDLQQRGRGARAPSQQPVPVEILVLDKMARLGGNSAKASSVSSFEH